MTLASGGLLAAATSGVPENTSQVSARQALQIAGVRGTLALARVR